MIQIDPKGDSKGDPIRDSKGDPKGNPKGDSKGNPKGDPKRFMVQERKKLWDGEILLM